MFIFSSVVYGEKVSAPLFHIILVIAWEMSVFHFAIYKAFAFSLSCMLALSLYVFLVHMSWIDTWNCVCFTGSVSLIVFHCKGDPMFVIYSAFFQCHYCEHLVQSIQLPDSYEVPWPIWVWRKQEQGELWNPAWAHLRDVCRGSALWKLTHLSVLWVRSSAGTTWCHSMEQ